MATTTTTSTPVPAPAPAPVPVLAPAPVSALALANKVQSAVANAALIEGKYFYTLRTRCNGHIFSKSIEITDPALILRMKKAFAQLSGDARRLHDRFDELVATQIKWKHEELDSNDENVKELQKCFDESPVGRKLGLVTWNSYSKGYRGNKAADHCLTNTRKRSTM